MTVIDQSQWGRKEQFDFFSTLSYPFFNLCFPVDVTNLRRYTKEKGLSFYYSMIFCVTAAMDEIEAFRVKIRGEKVILHDHLVPSFTFLKPGREDFQIATLETGKDMEDFCRRAARACQVQTAFMDEQDFEPDQLIYISSIPWMPITAISHERDLNKDDSIPRIAWGKYEERDGRLLLTCGAECSHRLVDGYHVGRFYQNLQTRINEL